MLGIGYSECSHLHLFMWQKLLAKAIYGEVHKIYYLCALIWIWYQSNILDTPDWNCFLILKHICIYSVHFFYFKVLFLFQFILVHQKLNKKIIINYKTIKNVARFLFQVLFMVLTIITLMYDETHFMNNVKK